MRRDTLEKTTLPLEGIAEHVAALLEEIQTALYTKAENRLKERIYTCNDYEEFKSKVKDGGFFLCPWDGTPETEARIKEETQATIRCVPFGYSQENLGCDMVSGKPATCRVIMARSY